MDDWTVSRVRTMSDAEKFCILGLHKGHVADMTFMLNAGRPDEKDVVFNFYYLGHPNLIGVCDSFSRRVFMSTQHFKGKQYMEDFADRNPNVPWEGPAVSARWSIQTGNQMRADAKFALNILNNNVVKPTLKRKDQTVAKPTFKIKPKPKFIAPEDRPDAGRYLMFHSDSDSYVECQDGDEAERLTNGGCDDVTGYPKHEAEFKRRKGHDPFQDRVIKPKFKLKPKPGVQQDLFDKPYRRPFIIKGRG